MTLLLLRRHAWRVPVALSLWGAGSVAATAADSATPPVVIHDPASPDAPAGPVPASVLGDFTAPALSVPTGDWRAINASVSGNAGMPGGHHDMSRQGDDLPTTPTGHAEHNMSASPASMDHSAMGHKMPMAPASGSAASVPMNEGMHHSAPTTPAPAAHGGHVQEGDSQ